MQHTEAYFSQEVNAECRGEIKELVDAKDEGALEERLGCRLAFGTAGLRGPMRGGYNGMNDLVMIQTTQGLASYLVEQFGEQEVKDRGVIIGYDHRKKGSLSSLTFARYCAAVFLNRGIKVYCLEGLVPTPFVPFGVMKLNCCAGLMITASHNPKADNGYKVYWSNGAQIIPPHDSGISRHIEKNLSPAIDYDASDDFVLSHERSEDVTVSISDAYMKAIAAMSSDVVRDTGLKIAYTAMHGIGGKWIERAFSDCQHEPVLCVPSQFQPDPEFPTVVFPNPEEKGALDASMAYADEQGCHLILANDPDADRLAVAEKAGSSWTVFSGNQIGQLLGHWQIKKWKESGAAGEAVVLTTVVSSRMLKAIAEKEGAGYADTLTGFKWIGNRALELMQEGKQVLLTYEEALGYCCGDVLCDKDGVNAAVVFACMAAYYRGKHSMSVADVMESLYDKYGRFVSYNSYVFCHDSGLTDRIFERIRTGGKAGKYFETVAGSVVTRTVDVTTGYDSGSSTGKGELPTTPGSHMVMFTFDNGVSVTLRTSGTEPKIKFYTELAGSGGQGVAAIKETLTTFVDEVVEALLQPTLHGLQRAS
jgi:phosphoglucomutase/phosphoglucomutase/phosphopentomutase